MVKTLHFQGRGCGLNPWFRKLRFPQAAQHSQTIKEKKKVACDDAGIILWMNTLQYSAGKLGTCNLSQTRFRNTQHVAKYS